MIEMLFLTRPLIFLDSTIEIGLYPVLLITIALPSERIWRFWTRPWLLRHLRLEVLFRLLIFRLSLAGKFGSSAHDWFLMDDLWNILESFHGLVKFFYSSLEIRGIIALGVKSWGMGDGFIMPWIKMTVFW